MTTKLDFKLRIILLGISGGEKLDGRRCKASDRKLLIDLGAIEAEVRPNGQRVYHITEVGCEILAAAGMGQSASEGTVGQ